MPEIKERYKVKYLGVFGSYVRGEASQTSDLDLLMEFEQGLPPSTSLYAWDDISVSKRA
jgi:predicted nucleotidyltransferase